MLYTENLRTLTHEDLMKSFIALPHRGDTNMYGCQNPRPQCTGYLQGF